MKPGLLLCQGDPRALGFAQGAGLPAQVHGANEALSQLEAFRLRQPRWLPFWLFRRLARRKAARQLEPAVRSQSPEMLERLHGIAAGARIPADNLWLIQAMEGLLCSVFQATPPPVGGCSALAVRGKRSASGTPIIAHNFDYLPIVQPFYFLRDARPRSQFRSLDFAVAPMSGCVDGINERGLAITYNYAVTVEDAVAAPTISMRISQALARCTNVQEAIDWIVAQPRWGAGLLMLADADGDLASLELSITKHTVRRPEGDADCLFHANKFQCTNTCALEVPADASYGDRAPTPLRGRPVFASSRQRFARFAELLADTKPLGEHELARLMADHGSEARPGSTTLCTHSDYWHTTACVQLLPAERKLRASFSTACQAEYSEHQI